MKESLPRLLLAGALGLQMACAGDGPVGPNDPPPAAVVAPSGSYVFRLELASDCGAPARAFTFDVRATAQNTPRSPGVQVYLEGVSLQDEAAPLLEMEFLFASPALRGTIGTTYGGVASKEGVYVAVRGTGFATVIAGAGGRGEVTEGTLLADLAFGRDIDDEGGLGTCDGAQHRFSLRGR